VTFGYTDVAARAGHRCEYCHAPEVLANFPFFIEHVIPRVHAPELIDDPENLALACPPCNLHKADRVQAVDPATGQSVQLFHPRRDVWAHHFEWGAEKVTLVGLTPTGRATVSALQINSLAQRRARAFWLTTDFFP
jgi:hypothetical protein